MAIWINFNQVNGIEIENLIENTMDKRLTPIIDPNHMENKFYCYAAYLIEFSKLPFELPITITAKVNQYLLTKFHFEFNQGIISIVGSGS